MAQAVPYAFLYPVRLSTADTSLVGTYFFLYQETPQTPAVVRTL
jgi:hypothetical protein